MSTFTVGKLERLKPKTRLRKLITLLLAAEYALSKNQQADLSLFLSLADSQIIREALPPLILRKLLELHRFLHSGGHGPERVIRLLNSLRHSILSHLGMEPAEWNLQTIENPSPAGGMRKTLPIRCYVEDLRSPYNVGSIFRTGEAFGIREILLSPDTPLPTNRRAMKTARGSTTIVPWLVSDLGDFKEKNILALETGGTPLDSCILPASGIVLIGSEELGLSPVALRMASQRVTIPMAGTKRSLNVAVAFGILMWEWYRQLTSPE